MITYEDKSLKLTIGKGSIPLYMQIKELLVAKISKGDWRPGDMIPSEMLLAHELEVSQGTVRKAITELVENNVLVRKQGRGTFVSNHDDHRALFHFFHITDNAGHKVLPDSSVQSCRVKPATKIESSILQLDPGASVIKIERVRNIENRPTITESIVLPAEPFARLFEGKGCHLPNMLYELYEKQFGVTIHSANEQLRAVVATKKDASQLHLEVGTPLLEIKRLALTLDKTPVEFRISRCNTKNHYYENTIF
jgi:GntR family transcriptional regulator